MYACVYMCVCVCVCVCACVCLCVCVCVCVHSVMEKTLVKINRLHNNGKKPRSIFVTTITGDEEEVTQRQTN